MAQSKKFNIFFRWHPRNGKDYLVNLYSNFGAKFFFMMMSTYIGIKGALHYFVRYVQLPYYQAANHGGDVQQEMFAISYVPWTIKGFIGVISDLLPLLGHQKLTYMAFYTILGTAGCLGTAILPLHIAHDSPTIPALLMFLIFLQTAALDLLMEGKYVQQMNKFTGSKPNIITFSWFCTLAGQVLPSVTVGPVSDVADPRILFYVFTPFALQPLIPMYFGGIVEDKVPKHENNKLNVERFKKEWKVMTLATAMGIASIGTVFIALIFDSSLIQILYSLGVALVMCTWAFFMIPPLAARFNVYNFLALCLYVNLQGAIEYFYTAGPECVENGPQFSMTFLKTYGQIAGTVAQIAGMFVFQVVMSNWKFRHIFWSTTLIRILASCFDIILVERLNLKVGIPDKVVYLVGYAVVYQLTYMMDFIPPIIMIAKLCPKNVEATMFALLAGYGNYGDNTSSHLGVFFMDFFGIKTTVTQESGCNFDNLTFMIIVGHGLLPAICMILAFILIPDAYLTDNLVDIQSKTVSKNKISEITQSPTQPQV